MKIRVLFRFLSIVSLSLILAACASYRSGIIPGHTDNRAFHLGRLSFPITTRVPEAQLAFNKGITLAYAFSHMAAEREFRRAAELDPQAPMPWWGVALVNGPHINFPLVPEDKAKIAWDALTKAKERAANVSALEKDLIVALTARYRDPQPKDRSKLDQAYAAAMKGVWERHPNNAEVAVLYAESLMDLHPWDLWDIKGNPKAWTPEIVATLERAIALNEKHPGAHHLYIHGVEASDMPQRGVPSADILRTLVPGSGHLVHMPAHIYLRVGRWEDAALANENAILADQEYKKAYPHPGFYAVYMMHNNHFLSFVRMMQGRKEAALKAARAMIAGIPPEFMREFGPIADGYMAIVIEVLMRFGAWSEILAEPQPPQNLPIATSLWRFARTIAYAALDKRNEAQAERTLFLKAVKKVPAEATFGNNKAHKLLKIAQHVIDGEMAAREKRYDSAIKSLRAAVNIEDTLMYDEPPDWILPVRHSLGLTLLRAGMYEEAEKIYREDLKKFPANGWSLYGLSRALTLQGKKKEADSVMADFKREWAGADTMIEGSCLCQPGV